MTTGPGRRSSSERAVIGARDDSYAALADPHRRYALHRLARSDGPLSVDELAADLAAWETARPVGERSSAGRTAIEISLVHCHLPKLAAAGLVEYDEDEGTVRLAGEGETVVPDLPAAGD